MSAAAAIAAELAAAIAAADSLTVGTLVGEAARLDAEAAPEEDRNDVDDRRRKLDKSSEDRRLAALRAIESDEVEAEGELSMKSEWSKEFADEADCMKSSMSSSFS